MPTHLLEASIYHGTRRAQARQGNHLAVCIEELANLRFTIILTAKWEASATEDVERRDDLRADLVSLRREYSKKIDEIAMTFGVQQAIDAKEEVERSVTVPQSIDLTDLPRDSKDQEN